MFFPLSQEGDAGLQAEWMALQRIECLVKALGMEDQGRFCLYHVRLMFLRWLTWLKAKIFSDYHGRSVLFVWYRDLKPYQNHGSQGRQGVLELHVSGSGTRGHGGGCSHERL